MAGNPSNGTRFSYAQLEQLWVQNGGATVWAPTMAAVAMLESGGNALAHNASGATGLWQIEVPGSSSGQSTQQMMDPNANAAQAVKLLGNGSGIQNWGHDPAGHWNSGDAIGNYVQDHGSQPLTTAQLVAAGFGQYTGAQATNLVSGQPVGLGGASGNPPASNGCSAKGGGLSGPLGIGGNIGNACQLKALTGGLLVGLGGAIMIIGGVLIFFGPRGVRQVRGMGRALIRSGGSPVGAAIAASQEAPDVEAPSTDTSDYDEGFMAGAAAGSDAQPRNRRQAQRQGEQATNRAGLARPGPGDRRTDRARRQDYEPFPPG